MFEMFGKCCDIALNVVLVRKVGQSNLWVAGYDYCAMGTVCELYAAWTVCIMTTGADFLSRANCQFCKFTFIIGWGIRLE